jgi:antitoxin (DNA-binding transcriptional repressor) of toxin-antitoxin stability system
MEPRHIGEGDLAEDIRSILRQVEMGGEVVIERDARPAAVIRPAEPVRRTNSECIALAEAHERATGLASVPDPDFAGAYWCEEGFAKGIASRHRSAAHADFRSPGHAARIGA